MAWVTNAQVGIAIGTTQATALGLDTAATFAQFERAAVAKVASVLQFAGYSVPSTIDNTTVAGAFLEQMAISLLVVAAYGGRKGIKFNPYVQEGLDNLAAVYDKRLPVPGMTPSTLGGYGGSKGSPITGPDARVPAFARKNMGGY